MEAHSEDLCCGFGEGWNCVVGEERCVYVSYFLDKLPHYAECFTLPRCYVWSLWIQALYARFEAAVVGRSVLWPAEMLIYRVCEVYYWGMGSFHYVSRLPATISSPIKISLEVITCMKTQLRSSHDVGSCGG